MSLSRASVSSFLVGSDLNINSARESLQNIKRISQDSYDGLNDENYEKTWNYYYLRDQFKLKDLESMFARYTSRINQAYFSVFLILLFLLTTIHFFVVLICNLVNSSLNIVIFDLVCYSIITVTSVVVLVFNESTFFKRRQSVKVLSYIVFVLILITNFLIPLYHFLTNSSPIYNPAYTTILIITCYLFLNIKKSWIAAVLGVFVSFCEVIYSTFIMYDVINGENNGSELWRTICSDVIFLLCVNGVGFYYRIMNEMVQRKTFLDRRACVMATLKLKYEEEQEDQLMLSIIPKYIIEEVKVDIMKTIELIEKSSTIPRQKPFQNPYIHTYDNVSILYADVVNFTALTSTLKPVTKLVETLNDLFGSFDDASEKFNVLRIKFLGDCYYCVSGLPPNPAPNHAEACVDLGLEMIQIIRTVRENSGVNIDMRIGVNSGQILSGLIGLTKWQFDVWSNDVLIANKMESTGEAGKVHITKKTRDLLTKQYNIIQTDRGKTREELKTFNLETYLVSPYETQRDSLRKLSIIPDENADVNDFPQFWEKSKLNNNSSHTNLRSYSRTPSNMSTLSNNTDSSDDYSLIQFRRESIRSNAPVLRRASGLNSQRIQVAMTDRRLTAGDAKRRTAFMNSYIKKYTEHLENTKINMENAIEKMPLTKYEQWFKVEDIRPVFISFREFKKETNFLKQIDPLFKFSVLIQVFAMIFCILLQNLTLSRWQWNLFTIYFTVGLLIFIVTPILWAKYIWEEHISDRELDHKPNSKFFRFIVRISGTVTKNWVIRTSLYIFTVSLCITCILIELIKCNEFYQSQSNFTNKTMTNETNEQCVTPWNMTRSMSLVIIIIFIFLKIHVWLKLILACITFAYYSYNIWVDSLDFFLTSESTNYNVSSNLSHTMVVGFLVLTLHLIDRQSDYLNRLDYNWNNQLNNEREQTNIKHKINSMLLKNILPVHVAELYLDISRKTDELFTEEYDNVAVMFATVVDFDFEEVEQRRVLEIMNNIIGDFDKLLSTQSGRLIEKIKVINWTYMAACGLDPGRKYSTDESEFSRRSFHNEHVVLTLLKFATKMKQVLKRVGSETFQPFKLRVGISHGEVTAGVVGSKKPLYDIWGDTVNMASRMESRGIPGKIQVPRNTAEIIVTEGYSCDFRDYIFVKGKGSRVPTYFVSLDEYDQLKLLSDDFYDTKL